MALVSILIAACYLTSLGLYCKIKGLGFENFVVWFSAKILIFFLTFHFWLKKLYGNYVVICHVCIYIHGLALVAWLWPCTLLKINRLEISHNGLIIVTITTGVDSIIVNSFDLGPFILIKRRAFQTQNRCILWLCVSRRLCIKSRCSVQHLCQYDISNEMALW